MNLQIGASLLKVSNTESRKKIKRAWLTDAEKLPNPVTTKAYKIPLQSLVFGMIRGYLFYRQGELYQSLFTVGRGLDLNRIHLDAFGVEGSLLNQVGAHLVGTPLGELLQTFGIDNRSGGRLRR